MNDDEKQCLNVLLKEYDTLRQEILGRINSRSQFATVLGGVAVFSSAKEARFEAIFVIITVLGIVLGLYYWRTAVLVARIGRHLSELETRINKLCGTELMTWQKVAAKNLLHRLFGESCDKTPE